MNKPYVITGASSGIGYALCCSLASRGENIIAIARRQDRLEILKNKYPENISTIATDLATIAGRNHVVEQISNIPNIKGLVNNAATNDPVDYLEHLSIDSWQQQCAINLDAPIFLTQALIPHLSGGRVINMTTGTTNFVVSGVAGYAITKAALNTFTKYLSAELKNKNILVTAAHPGIVRTELVTAITNHPNKELAIVEAQKHFEQENKYLDINISVKFLTWLLLDAKDSLYTGDIIGIYNQKYQPLWHDQIIPSPYPPHIDPP